MTATSTKPPRARKEATKATLPTISNPASHTAQTKTIALDAGNYNLKYWDGTGQPRAIRSVRFQLPQGRDPVRYSDSSPLVELLDGTRYHFGTQAFKYRRQQQTVIENKVDLARLHLYACLEPTQVEDGVCRLTLNLHVSTPEPSRHRQALREQLLGIHEFERNEISFHVTVEQVEVEREGIGSYRCAQRMGLIAESGYTIVIDIGGGTWLSRLIDAEGEVIDENVMDRGGAYELATAISFDKRLSNALGTTADPGIIMDGFQRQHCYADTGYSWQEWLEEYLDPWYKNIFRTVKSQYTPFMPRVTRFLVTGGSSQLISDRLQGFKLFAVMPDPQFANVRGLFPAEPQLCMTTN
ncbi:MAG: ParM/StbA family protein [Synechococcales bacterium]|nr:ParM/StbA family protein [Synechococcales bacterium]